MLPRLSERLRQRVLGDNSLARSPPPIAHRRERLDCLNLGCGNDYEASTPERAWVNADVNEDVRTDFRFDAFRPPYPIADASFDFVKAYDFLEHVPHVVFDLQGRPVPRDGFLVVLDEIWRVLRPGGVLEARFPASKDVKNDMDPTHTRRLRRETFELYLTRQGPYSFYTRCHWELVAYDRGSWLPHRGNDLVRLRKPLA